MKKFLILKVKSEKNIITVKYEIEKIIESADDKGNLVTTILIAENSDVIVDKNAIAENNKINLFDKNKE